MIQNAKTRLTREFENANVAGAQQIVSTLTGIKSKVTEQKLHIEKPSDYMPVIVGENAFSDDYLKWLSAGIQGDFESGLIDPNSHTGGFESVDAEVQGLRVPFLYWGKKHTYNILELERSARTGNWDKVSAAENARYKDWMTGIQQIAFLGSQTVTGVRGLLTQSGVTSNTTIIDKPIKDMSETEFETLLRDLVPAYYANTNDTALPDTFVIPTSDFLGLGVATSEQFPLKSKYDRLMEMFVGATGNANFKIMPSSYAQATRNSAFLGGGSGLNRYALYINNEDTGAMDIPIDYTTTTQDMFNGIEYTSVAYGQFSGYQVYRPLEIVYFDYS